MDERQLTYEVKPWELWFGVGAGPILWAIHLVVSYGLVALHCNWRFFSFTMLGAPGIMAILVILTIVTVAIVLYAGLRARRNWNVMRDQSVANGGDREERTEERHEFLSVSGMLLSALFAATVLVSLIPVLVLSPCTFV